uniref:Uncharacterized protein n=1 Tax=Arundo donax TaxID=35708 RepID=A0A0A9FEW5_ARUDO
MIRLILLFLSGSKQFLNTLSEARSTGSMSDFLITDEACCISLCLNVANFSRNVGAGFLELTWRLLISLIRHVVAQSV